MSFEKDASLEKAQIVAKYRHSKEDQEMAGIIFDHAVSWARQYYESKGVDGARKLPVDDHTGYDPVMYIEAAPVLAYIENLTKPTAETERAADAFAEKYCAETRDRNPSLSNLTIGFVGGACLAAYEAGASNIQAQKAQLEKELEAALMQSSIRMNNFLQLEQKVKELEVENEQLKGKVFDEKFMRNIALGRNDIHREDILNLESENAALKAENAELKRKGQGNE